MHYATQSLDMARRCKLTLVAKLTVVTTTPLDTVGLWGHGVLGSFCC